MIGGAGGLTGLVGSPGAAVVEEGERDETAMSPSPRSNLVSKVDSGVNLGIRSTEVGMDREGGFRTEDERSLKNDDTSAQDDVCEREGKRRETNRRGCVPLSCTGR